MIKQPMMLLVGDQEVDDYTLIANEIEDIAASGFDGVCMEFRSCRYNEFDLQGKQAIKYVYDECRKKGLQFSKTIPPSIIGFLSKNPILKRKVIKSVVLNQIDGVKTCGDVKIENRLPTEVFAVYRIESEGVFKPSEKDAVVLENEELFAKRDGRYVVYLTYIREEETDYANKAAFSFLDEYLDSLSDFKLDGIAMDEFGTGTRLDKVYLANDSFFELFTSKYGYDLREELYLLDYKDVEGKFSKVRIDYFTLTNDITYDYQHYAKKIFTQKYGKDIFIGFHHTWWGEGNSGDLWAGNIDYFRLAENLSGGFVDAQYDSERTMTSMSLLAESIAKRRGGYAWNMCWDRRTTPEKFDYFSRLLAVRNIHRVGHAVSKTEADKFPEFNWFVKNIGDNSAFGNVKQCLKRELLFYDFIGKTKNEAKVAITYNWESCAYFNDDYMHYHRLSLKALADKLVQNNISVDIIPSNVDNFDVYNVVFVGWATVMPKNQWEALKQAAKEGKEIIFFGPPAMVTTDGKNISGEFTELTGAKIEKYDIFYGGYEVYQWDFWFTDKQIPMRNWMDEKSKSQFRKENVRYYAYELPLTDEFFNVLNELSVMQTIKSVNAISKVYKNGREKVICITSRWQSKINEEIVFDGLNIRIENGDIVGIKTENGKIKDVIASSGTKLFLNDNSLNYIKIEN